jgi:hypothetical protein
MFDPTLIDALSHALAPPPPAVVRSAFDIDGALAAHRAENRRRYDEASRALERWVAQGRALREDLWTKLEHHGDQAGPAELEALERIIAAVDERQALMAKEIREDERQWKRLVKRGFRISPEHGAIARDFMMKALELAERQHNERADFGLFLRALRARFDPDARGGRTFDNPDELEGYLRSATA